MCVCKNIYILLVWKESGALRNWGYIDSFLNMSYKGDVSKCSDSQCMTMAGAIYKLSKESSVTWRSQISVYQTPSVESGACRLPAFSMSKKKELPPNLRISRLGVAPCPPNRYPQKIQASKSYSSTSEASVQKMEQARVSWKNSYFKGQCFLETCDIFAKKTFFPLGKDQWRSPRHSLFIIGKKSWPRKRFSPTEPLGVAPGKTEPWNHGPAVLITSSSGNLQNISAWFSCETILWLGMIVWSLGIQSPNVRWWARGVLHHLQKRKVFRFHYHSQVRWLDP